MLRRPTIAVLVIVLVGLLGGCGGTRRNVPSTHPPTASSGPLSHLTQNGSYLGDMDGDGQASVGDAIKILRIVVALDRDHPCADANQNGSTDVGDAIMVLRCVVGLDDTWPIGECGGGTQFDVQWDPSTTLVEESQLALLKDADTDNHVYTFDAAGVASSGLDLSPGRVMVIHGLTVRRITSVQQSGPDLVVETEYATLTEAIAEGTIAWDRLIDFSPQTISTVTVAGQEVRPRADGVVPQFKFTVGDFTYEIDWELLGDKATFKFTVEKSLAGPAGAKFVAEGEIRSFRSSDLIEIQGSQLQKFDHKLEGIEGDLTLSLVVAASGRDVVNLEPTYTLMTVPFMVGPLPVQLTIKIQFVINVSVPIDGSAQINARFTYDSDLGLQFDGIDVQSTARLGGFTIDEDKMDVGASGAIGVNFGVGFPRIGLSIAMESIVGWVQPAYLIGGSFTFTPPCKEVKARFLAAAGYSLSFLGKGPKFTGSIVFFDHEEVLFRSAECPDASAASLVGRPGYLQALEQLLGMDDMLMPANRACGDCPTYPIVARQPAPIGHALLLE